MGSASRERGNLHHSGVDDDGEQEVSWSRWRQIGVADQPVLNPVAEVEEIERRLGAIGPTE